jgi:alpha-amylase/alpha-mannosidase (GH57 family)
MGSNVFCVHGHFYQPPREDAISGVIPEEEGAAPYRNWNERINARCYRPNADLGNFGKISFNVGPTLLNWLAENDSQTYHKILAQDRENYERYGVGNAMAQAYHHTILPLSSRVDKMTQIQWGIADFEHHFGHKPAGFWLPEAAVDTETLVVLADCGITYTILAPWQSRTHPIESGKPYLVDLPGKRCMSVFFYDQDVSTRISFDPGATVNADAFVVNILLPKFPAGHHRDAQPHTLMVASDGELYGHHQDFRDKFLARLVNSASRDHHLELTFPGLWIKKYPPTQKVEIVENTSWSCHHGVTRWMGECGCTYGGTWKAPLRRGLNHLATLLDRAYLDVIRSYGIDPWNLRHTSIGIRLGITDASELIGEASGRKLSYDELRPIALLLDAQFERQRMFTSCAWYFDDFDRIEPRNSIAYAAQAVWLTFLATGTDLTDEAMTLLKGVISQRTGLRGDEVFKKAYRRITASYSIDDPLFNAATSFST